jgi:DNA (cytosine-5)-methyltransferase 1
MTFRAEPYREPESEAVVGTVTELFAGVGGFRIGLSRANLKTVFSNQWEPSTKVQHASDCYLRNFGPEGHFNEDVVALVERHVASAGGIIPKTDILVGGFPCQDYSVAKTLNSSKGLEGRKGVLWWSIRDLVEANRPRFVFLENVDRLLKSPSSQRGRDFAIMLSTLGSLGYRIEWRTVSAADYGFPQRRIRVFILATQTDSSETLSLDHGAEIVSSSGVLARAFPIAPPTNFLHQIEISETPDVLTEQFGLAAKKSPFLRAGVYQNGLALTTEVEPDWVGPKAVLNDVLVPPGQVPNEFWIDDAAMEEWRYLKDAKAIPRVHRESGTPYFYSEGRMAFPDSTENPSRTILTGEGGKSPSIFNHIILQEGRFRRLLPIELERLSGFPDEFTRVGVNGEIRDSRRAFFIGNALVVGLVERVGRVIAQDLRQ